MPTIEKPVNIDNFFLIYTFYRALDCYGGRDFWVSFQAFNSQNRCEIPNDKG